MKIDSENIEETMFEYFEGNLSENEKAELLNFVHQNPEYEKDFAQWAQTYAHVEETVPDYGLAEQLLRKPPIAWPFAKLAFFGTAMTISMGVLIYFLNFRSQDEKQIVPVETISSTIVTESVQNSKPEYFKQPSAKPNKLSSAISTKQNFQVSSEKEEIKINYNSYINSNLLPETKETNIKTIEEIVASQPKVELVVIQPEVSKPDSVLTPIAEKTAEKAVAPKKVKKRLPLNLKPNSNFIPVNPNF